MKINNTIEINNILEEGLYKKYIYNLHLRNINNNDELEELFDKLSSYIGYGIICLFGLMKSSFYVLKFKKD
jgi:hypothetical protein